MRKIMHSAAAITVAFAALTVASAYGAAAATVEGASGTVTDTLTPKAQAVCDGPFVLTAAAMAVCQSQNWPTVIKDGSRFNNTGVGAEFNTLIRQLPVMTGAVSETVPAAQ